MLESKEVGVDTSSFFFLSYQAVWVLGERE